MTHLITKVSPKYIKSTMRFYEKLSAAQKIAILFIALGLLFQLFLKEDYDTVELLHKVLTFLFNIGVELVGIGVTILVIDRAVEDRQMQELKEKLIRELGSEHNTVADSAARELRSHHSKNLNWLEDGSLIGKKFRRANLKRVDLRFSNFSGANLRRANLSGTKLTNAKFKNADMRGVNLHKAWVGGFDSSKIGADFTGVDLFLSNLSFADCSKVDFTGAKLDRCNFIGANLEFAFHLEKVEKFDGSFFDDSTIWPKGFDPISRGMQKVKVAPFETGPETNPNSLRR